MNNYFTITNFDFDIVETTVYTQVDESRKYSVTKMENGDVVLETSFLAAPCVYWIKKDNLFCFCFEAGQVEYFAKINNISIFPFNKATLGEIGMHLKKSVAKNYEYSFNFIENWKKVTIHSDGTFEKEDYPLIPYSLDLKENYTLFINWLKKYKQKIIKLISEDKFVPTLTGGLDSRTLIGLYREKLSEKNINYHLKAVKTDGKNQIEKGSSEIIIADAIAHKIGLQERLENLPEGKISSTSILNENARFLSNPNNTDFIYKYIQHSYDNVTKYERKLNPFLDDDYLKFKQETDFMRVLLALLLIPDLIQYRLIGTTEEYEENPDGYLFEEKYANIIPKAKELIAYWEDKYGAFKI